jgi:hypothetical protein
MRQRTISKITIKPATLLNEKPSIEVKKMKLQVWRERFRLLRARILVQKTATKSRRKLHLRRQIYRKSLSSAGRLKKKTSYASRTLIRRGRQLTTATLSTQAFRVVRFSGMRCRVKTNRRLIRLRVKNYAPSRNQRGAFKLLRRTLRTARRIYYLQKQRPTCRRSRLRAALHAVRYSVSDKYSIGVLYGEHSQTRRVRLHEGIKRLRRLQYARRIDRRRHKRQRQHRPYTRQRRRTLQVFSTKTKLRFLGILTSKRFSIWKFLFATTLRARLRRRHSRRLRSTQGRFKRRSKKHVSVKNKRVKSAKEKARKKLAEKSPKWWQLTRLKLRGKFIRRQRRKTKRMFRHNAKIKMIPKRIKNSTRQNRLSVTQIRRKKSSLLTGLHFQKQRDQRKVRRLKARVFSFLRKVRTRMLPEIPSKTKDSKAAARRALEKLHAGLGRKYSLRKKLKIVGWLRLVSRNARTVRRSDIIGGTRKAKLQNRAIQKIYRNFFFVLAKAAIQARSRAYLRARRRSFTHKLKSYVQKNIQIKKNASRRLQKHRRKQRYIYRGVRSSRRLVRPYGPLKFLRWQRRPRRFIHWRLRRSVRFAYALAGAQFRRGQWTRRYLDRKHATTNALKPSVQIRHQKKSCLRYGKKVVGLKLKIPYKLPRHKTMRAVLSPNRRTGRWIIRRRPICTRFRAAVRSFRKLALSAPAYKHLRKAIVRRLLSRRVSAHGRAYNVKASVRSDDTDFHYQPSVRFTLRRFISIGKSRRIRRRYRRALRRRRYLVNNRRLAVLQTIPVYNRRTDAVSAVRSVHAADEDRVHRRSIVRNRKNAIIDKVVSIELQNYLSTTAVCSIFSKKRGVIEIAQKTRRKVRRFMRAAESSRKHWMTRLEMTGRPYWTRWDLGRARFVYKRMHYTIRRKRYSYGFKISTKRRKVWAHTIKALAPLEHWARQKENFNLIAQKYARRDKLVLTQKRCPAQFGIAAAVSHEIFLKHQCTPVFELFDNEKSEKIYSKLEIGTPKK